MWVTPRSTSAARTSISSSSVRTSLRDVVRVELGEERVAGVAVGVPGPHEVEDVVLGAGLLRQGILNTFCEELFAAIEVGHVCTRDGAR